MMLLGAPYPTIRCRDTQLSRIRLSDGRIDGICLVAYNPDPEDGAEFDRLEFGQIGDGIIGVGPAVIGSRLKNGIARSRLVDVGEDMVIAEDKDLRAISDPRCNGASGDGGVAN